MKNIIFLIFLLFIFNSCSDELITIVDEYNPPYDIKPIPNDDGTISISFWSGVLADDFAGFNLYISGPHNANNPFTSFGDALQNTATGSYPTYPTDTHTRSNFTLSIPGTYTPGSLYYVTVTAYGTNELAEGGRIETKIDSGIPIVPRQATPGNGNFNVNTTTTPATVSANANGQIKSYGYQTNFNAITVFTNNNTSSIALPYIAGGLYISISADGSTLSKLWINPSGSGNNTSASHSQAGNCNTI